MDIGLNHCLKGISSALFLRDSAERRKIDASVQNIINRLNVYFNEEIDEASLFGSYTRGTILPRRFDPNSDIDILVEFNTDKYEELRPDSYRNQLRQFAGDKYPSSLVIKDHPSVVVELDHIKFDLVPAIFHHGLFYDSIKIPGKNGRMGRHRPREI